VQCIVVKDFSRFGRNYIDVGDYLEQIFPFLRVRFISVCDNYDSEKDGDVAGDMEFAFKNLMNDWYSKDLSAKCKAGIAAVRKAGKYHSSAAPYGYAKAKGDIHRLVVDNAAADVVRRIFGETLAGRRPSDIAKALNKDGIPTPAKYKNACGAQRRGFREDNIWTGANIGKILRDIRYTGLLVQGIYRSKGVGSKQSRKLPESEWEISPVRHEAVVSEEDFAAVKAMLAKTGKKPSFGGERNISAGKVFCGGCGHAMFLSGGGTKFYCKYKSYFQDGLCASGTKTSAIEAAMLKAAAESEPAATCERAPSACVQSKTEIFCGSVLQRNISKKIEAMQDEKLALYIRYADGETEKGEYISKRNAIDVCLSELQSRRDAAERRLSAESAKDRADSVRARADVLNAGGRLTREIADALIDRVTVYADGRTEVKLKSTVPFRVTERGGAPEPEETGVYADAKQ
jgi:DNA invertase Pin-like site-specific DNA recombinase